MADQKRDMLFRYLGDSKNLERASGRAEKALGGVDQKSGRGGRSLDLMRGAAGKLGVVLGGAALAGQARVAINRAEEMSSAYAITEQIIKQTGGASGVTAEEIKRLSKEQSILTGIDKALVTEGTNVLLTFKNIKNEVGAGNDIFSRTQGIMLDMATVMGTDAKSGAVQLGKALNDPIAGLSALARVGVQFTDQQKAQITAMVEAGDVAGAQRLILGELESQFGGTAAASADATAKIGNAWEEVQEQIGNALLPVVEAMVPAFERLAEEAPSAFRKIGLGFDQMRRAAGSAVDVIDFLLGPTANLADVWDEQDEKLFQVNRRLVQYHESLAAGKDESLLFVSVLADLVRDGDYAETTLQGLIGATGISAEKFEEAAEYALAHREELGLTAEQAIDLKQELGKLQAGTSDLTREMGEGEGAAGDMGGALGDLEGDTDDAAGGIDKVRESIRKLADPVFAAKKATEEFEEVLERIQEDSVVTAEEADELSAAYGRMVDANDAITPENVLAYEQQTREALGRVRQGVDITVPKLDGLPVAASRAIDTTQAEFLRLIRRGIDVRVQAQGPTRAEINSMVRGAIRSLGARGINAI